LFQCTRTVIYRERCKIRRGRRLSRAWNPWDYRKSSGSIASRSVTAKRVFCWENSAKRGSFLPLRHASKKICTRLCDHRRFVGHCTVEAGFCRHLLWM